MEKNLLKSKDKNYNSEMEDKMIGIQENKSKKKKGKHKKKKIKKKKHEYKNDNESEFEHEFSEKQTKENYENDNDLVNCIIDLYHKMKNDAKLSGFSNETCSNIIFEIEQEIQRREKVNDKNEDKNEDAEDMDNLNINSNDHNKNHQNKNNPNYLNNENLRIHNLRMNKKRKREINEQSEMNFDSPQKKRKLNHNDNNNVKKKQTQFEAMKFTNKDFEKLRNHPRFDFYKKEEIKENIKDKNLNKINARNLNSKKWQKKYDLKFIKNRKNIKIENNYSFKQIVKQTRTGNKQREIIFQSEKELNQKINQIYDYELAEKQKKKIIKEKKNLLNKLKLKKEKLQERRKKTLRRHNNKKGFSPPRKKGEIKNDEIEERKKDGTYINLEEDDNKNRQKAYQKHKNLSKLQLKHSNKKETTRDILKDLNLNKQYIQIKNEITKQQRIKNEKKARSLLIYNNFRSGILQINDDNYYQFLMRNNFNSTDIDCIGMQNYIINHTNIAFDGKPSHDINAEETGKNIYIFADPIKIAEILKFESVYEKLLHEGEIPNFLPLPLTNEVKKIKEEIIRERRDKYNQLDVTNLEYLVNEVIFNKIKSNFRFYENKKNDNYEYNINVTQKQFNLLNGYNINMTDLFALNSWYSRLTIIDDPKYVKIEPGNFNNTDIINNPKLGEGNMKSRYCGRHIKYLVRFEVKDYNAKYNVNRLYEITARLTY